MAPGGNLTGNLAGVAMLVSIALLDLMLLRSLSCGTSSPSRPPVRGPAGTPYRCRVRPLSAVPGSGVRTAHALILPISHIVSEETP